RECKCLLAQRHKLRWGNADCALDAVDRQTCDFDTCVRSTLCFAPPELEPFILGRLDVLVQGLVDRFCVKPKHGEVVNVDGETETVEAEVPLKRDEIANWKRRH